MLQRSIWLAGLLAVSLVPLAISGPVSVPTAAAAVACPALSGDGPLGMWSAEGTTAGTPGPELSGATTYDTGISGDAFVLSGSGLSSTSVATVTGGVSVMAWVKPSSMLSVQTVMSRSTGPSFTGALDVSHGYALRIGFPWGVEWEIDDPTSMAPEVLRSQTYAAMDDGDWHHVAATWEPASAGSPGSMAIFVDGVEVARRATLSASINPADSTPFMIGGEHDTGFGFTGSIDEAMLFGRAITASEVARCTVPPVVPGPAGFDPNGTGRGAVRFKSQNTGNEVYLGTSLGAAGGRVEAPATWPDGSYPITFSWNGSNLSTTGNGANLSYPIVPPCTSWNKIQIFIRATSNSASTALNNATLNGRPLGDFGPVTHTPADPLDTETLQWTITGNFASSFVLTGDLVVSGWTAGNEGNRLEITAGCV